MHIYRMMSFNRGVPQNLIILHHNIRKNSSQAGEVSVSHDALIQEDNSCPLVGTEMDGDVRVDYNVHNGQSVLVVLPL